MNIGATIDKNSLRFTIVNMKQIIAENSTVAHQEYINVKEIPKPSSLHTLNTYQIVMAIAMTPSKTTTRAYTVKHYFILRFNLQLIYY